MTLFLVLATLAAAPPADGGMALVAASMKNPITVTSKKLQLANKLRQGIFTDNVQVQRGTTHMSCDRLIAHYAEASEITRVQCDGHVVVVDGDRFAKGEHADFDNRKGLLEVTGHPELRKGKSLWTTGDRVLYEVAKDDFWVDGHVATVVEGGSDSKGLPPPKAPATEEKRRK